MPMTSWVWTGGLFDEPRTDLSREFEALRQRHAELARQARDRLLDEQAAAAHLEQAERTAREAKAEHSALGGPAEPMRDAVKRLQTATKAHERAVERHREAGEALEFLERRADQHVGKHAHELLAELDLQAQAAREAAVAALHQAGAALAAWQTVARRQEVVIGASGGTLSHLRSPYADLGELVALISRIHLPDASLAKRVAERGAA